MDIDLTGATVIVVQPNDRLVFVIKHQLDEYDFENAMEQLEMLFPGQVISMVSSCEAVIHEPKSDAAATADPGQR